MKTLVKIYGERNSGTNFLAEALHLNFNCHLLDGHAPLTEEQAVQELERQQLSGIEARTFFEALNDDSEAQSVHQTLGWKHSSPPLDMIDRHPQAQEILFLVISKDPFRWLRSFYAHPYHCLYSAQLDFSGFIRHYWLTLRRDRLAASILKNPVQLYNLKMQAYADLLSSSYRTLHIQYKDLLFDFQAVMRLLAIYLNPKQVSWQIPQASTKTENWNYQDYQQKYFQEMSQYQADDYQWVLQEIDWDLMNRLGYFAEERLSESIYLPRPPT